MQNYSKRVNWTIQRDCITLLKVAQKRNPRDISLSKLVEYALRKTYEDPLVALNARGKELMKELSTVQAEIERLKEVAEANK